MYTLYIGNKNYSSWSLRVWLLMRELDIPFHERLVPFGGDAASGFGRFSPTGMVPCLLDQGATVWDSLAITEHLAERHAGAWPEDPAARSWARCAAAEMHAGFALLRTSCPMSLGIRVRLASMSPRLQAELARIEGLWREGLDRFGGPFLAGPRFSAVDAFFAPVAFRLLIYDLRLGASAAAYAERIRSRPAMREWYAAALREPWRDPTHEEEARAAGVWLADLREHASGAPAT
jgi:glutathione S-transferase